MKVLVFTSQFCRGGAELLGAELAVSLNASGFRADVAGLYQADQESVAARDRLLRRGIPAIHFLGLSPHPGVLSLFRGIWKLRKLLREQKYDVVETSSVTPSLMSALARLGTPARHVAGIHFVYERKGRPSLRERLYLAALKLPGTFVYAVSNFARRAWIGYSKMNPSKVRMIYNSLPARGEEPRSESGREEWRKRLDIPDDARLVLCAGRLAAYKRQDLVVEALAPLCAREKLVLLFVGTRDDSVPGTAEMLERMEGLIRVHGLQEHVRLLGQRDDLPEIMRGADLLVHATNKESFGLVLIEAAAARLPIIATAAEAIPEILEGSKSMLVPAGDIAALREAARKFLSLSPAEVESMRASGAHIPERFSQQERTRKMVALFSDVCKEKA